MTQPPTTTPELDTTDEIAVGTERAGALIDVSARQIRDYIREGTLRAKRLPHATDKGEFRIEVTELRRFIREECKPALAS